MYSLLVQKILSIIQAQAYAKDEQTIFPFHLLIIVHHNLPNLQIYNPQQPHYFSINSKVNGPSNLYFLNLFKQLHLLTFYLFSVIASYNNIIKLTKYQWAQDQPKKYLTNNLPTPNRKVSRPYTAKKEYKIQQKHLNHTYQLQEIFSQIQYQNMEKKEEQDKFSSQSAKNEKGEDVQTRSINEHSYKQVFTTSINLGRALINRKLYHEESIKKMKVIGIYSKNRYQWFVTDWACLHFGITSVPLYDTLGMENLNYCIHQSEMTTIFATIQTITALLELKDFGYLKNIISYEIVPQNIRQKIENKKLKLLYYDDLIKQGEKLTNIKSQDFPITGEDCYTFSYTSGTTGPPKGAMISHTNILSQTASFTSLSDLNMSTQDVYISYLPLPHLMERSIAMYLFYSGSYLVISCGIVAKLKDDCAVVKPTFFVSVPRLYNKIVENTKAKFQAIEGIKKCLVNAAVDSKLNSARTDGSFKSGFYDSLVFSSVKQAFGGNIRVMATGSAPINPQVHIYMKSIMCCPLIEGYGQTQSSAGVLFSRAFDTEYGTLSEISVGAELKLCDIPEMKYTSQDKDANGRSTPRGQIWIRGPQVFLGYYKLDEITKQTLTSDCWLKTGDVGQINGETLSFKIIDRKKNIFKLQQGEYVAPDKVENIYLKQSLVSEAFVHGDSMKSYAVAIITPNQLELNKLAKEKGIDGTYHELCRNVEIRTLFLKQINQYARKQGLNGFELAKNVFLDNQGFAPKKILTNTMKLIRFQARIIYKKNIQDLYKEGEIDVRL